MADPLAAVAALPRGAAGVIYRPEGLGAAEQLRLGRALAALCRTRRLALAVAGDGRLAARLGAGTHWREGRRPDLATRRTGLRTGSAHGVPGLVRARRAGLALVFLSPVFATDSHPGAPTLGAVRFAALAGRAGLAVAALGGVGAANVRRLGRRAAAVGAIGALRPA
ncbi:MAG: thiamine phosphate synthase [Rhodospirillales bacterium]|nr:thiamine phosphate synthase [Rhodospirillales bacterium]